MIKMIFVLAVYNNESEVQHFVEQQLLKQDFTNFIIYIVLNAANHKMYFADDRVQVLTPEKNLGYLGALRYVMEHKRPDYNYVTLCNTDIDLQSTHFLKVYINQLERHNFSLAGPMIKSTVTQTNQNPLYTIRLSKFKLIVLKNICKHYLIFILYQLLFYIKRLASNKELIEIVYNPYALHGSFITLSNEYFKKGGTLDYPVFLYGEELFLAEESVRINLTNILCTSMEIKHNEHSTTGLFKSRKQVEYLRQSVDYIYKTYYA